MRVASLGYYHRVCGLYLGSSSSIDSPRDSTRPTTARKTRSVPYRLVWFRVVRNRPPPPPPPPPPPLQHQIAELQRQYDLLRQTCASLTKCHSKALKECEVKGESLGQPLSLSVYLSDIFYIAITDRWGNAGGWQVFSSRGSCAFGVRCKFSRPIWSCTHIGMSMDWYALLC